MKKKILSILILMPFIIQAQTDTLQLSLDEAMHWALTNRNDIKANEMDVTLARNKLAEKKSSRLPEINITGDADYNTQISPTYVPAGFAGLTQPELLVLGAKNRTSVGVNLNLPIIQPGHREDVEIAKNNIAIADIQNKEYANDINEKVCITYLNVLLNQLQMKISAERTARFKEDYEITKKKYEQQEVIKTDYLQTQLNFRNAKLQEQDAKNEYSVSLLTLKNLLNIPETISLILRDSLNAEMPEHDIPETVNRSELVLLQMQQTQNKLQLQKSKKSILPSLSLVSGYGQNFLNQGFDYSDTHWWKPSSYVGLQLKFSITGLIKNKNETAFLTNLLSQARLREQQQKYDIQNEIAIATIKLNSSRENITEAKTNYEYSKEIYNNQMQQFALGAFDYTKRLEAERSIEVAEETYIKHVYDYLKAKYALLNAMGRL